MKDSTGDLERRLPFGLRPRRNSAVARCSGRALITTRTSNLATRLSVKIYRVGRNFPQGNKNCRM
jgi:hypothetical protein